MPTNAAYSYTAPGEPTAPRGRVFEHELGTVQPDSHVLFFRARLSVIPRSREKGPQCHTIAIMVLDRATPALDNDTQHQTEFFVIILEKVNNLENFRDSTTDTIPVSRANVDIKHLLQRRHTVLIRLERLEDFRFSPNAQFE